MVILLVVLYNNLSPIQQSQLKLAGENFLYAFVTLVKGVASYSNSTLATDETYCPTQNVPSSQYNPYYDGNYYNKR